MSAKAVFAKNLKAAMLFRQMSQGDIHRKTKLAQSTVGRVLSMAHAPDLETVETLSRSVGFQAWQLLVPTFQPDSPPFLPRLTEEERALYDKFQSLLRNK